MRTADELDWLIAELATERAAFLDAVARGVWATPHLEEFMQRVIDLAVDYAERAKASAPLAVVLQQPVCAFPPGVTDGPAMQAVQDALDKRFPLTPPAEPSVKDRVRCGFCGKPRREVAKLVTSATTGAVICNECIAVSQVLVKAREPESDCE